MEFSHPRNFYITDASTMMPRAARRQGMIWFIFEMYSDFNEIKHKGAHFKWIVDDNIKSEFGVIRERFKILNGWEPTDGTIPAFCVWLNNKSESFDEKSFPKQVNVESIRIEMLEKENNQ